MKRALLGLAVAVLAVTPIWAQDEGEDAGLGFEVRADVVGRYYWRGYDLSHADPAALVYTTWAPPAAKGFWIDVGFIMGLKNDAALGDDKTEIDEADITVGWEWELGDGAVTAGVAYYYYDYSSTWTRDVAYLDNSDAELNLYASWQAAEHFVPGVEYYRGLDDGIKGDYVELGLTFPFAPSESWAFEPKLAAGWSSQYDVDNKFTHYTATLPLAWSSGAWKVTASANFAHVVDPEAFNPEELVGKRPKKDLFWVGLGMSWSF